MRHAQSRATALAIVAAALAIASAAFASGGNKAQYTLDVTATADNCYAIGLGDANGPNSLTTTVVNSAAADIGSCGTGPELYSGLPAYKPSNNILYIVAFNDSAVTQGLLAQLNFGGTKFYTGSQWDVYDTGKSTGYSFLSTENRMPSLSTIRGYVATANAGGTLGSKGWVGGHPTAGAIGTLYVGQSNVAGPDFGQVCTAGANGIDAAAKWIWYNPPGGPADPLADANSSARNTHILIFRLLPSTFSGQDVPALDPRGLLLVSLLMLGAGVYFATRKRERTA